MNTRSDFRTEALEFDSGIQTDVVGLPPGRLEVVQSPSLERKQQSAVEITNQSRCAGLCISLGAHLLSLMF